MTVYNLYKTDITGASIVPQHYMHMLLNIVIVCNLLWYTRNKMKGN